MRIEKFILLLFIIGSVLFLQIYGAVKAAVPSPNKDNLLGVVVMVNGDSIKVKGYCIYVKDGKEIRKELEKDDAWGWNFHGEYIKEVGLQKVSGDASYRLFIMEGKDSASGQAVFESDSISSKEPVVYKRNQ